MKRYDEFILQELVNRYENSSLYYKKNQVSVSIGVQFKENFIPAYFDESSMQYEIIHEQMRELEMAGFIEIKWKNKRVGHIIEKVILKIERISDIYERLNRKTKAEKEQSIRRIIQSEVGNENEVVQKFAQWVLSRLDAGESIKRYVDIENPEELKQLLQGVHAVMKNREELFVREFSIIHFHDSKIFETIAGKITDLIKEFGKCSEDTGVTEFMELTELTKEQILEEYNIFHNPSWIMMKGCGLLKLGENQISLNHLIGGIGVQSQDLQQLQVLPCASVKRILTIENLTVFHRWQEPETLILYLGGYHNPAKRVFLKKVYEVYPRAKYEHFGDIDCGGFRIYHDLCKKTEIPFEAYCMDKITMECYVEYGKSLTASDEKELKRMLEMQEYEKHKEVIQYMLQCRKKLEQECVYRKS